MAPDMNNTAVVTVDGRQIYCENRSGVDCFRYYFLGGQHICIGGIDHPHDHNGDYVARKHGGTKNLGQDFTHEEVVAWLLEPKEEDSNG